MTRRGRPRVPLDLAKAALEIHDLGVPWHEVEQQTGISRRTILRRVRDEGVDRGQNSQKPSEGATT